MKYLKLYESISDNLKSDLCNIVYESIDNTYPDKNNLSQTVIASIKGGNVPKENWIKIVIGCLSDDDKKELGTFFINNYIKGQKNKIFFQFFYNKIKEKDPNVAELLNSSWRF